MRRLLFVAGGMLLATFTMGINACNQCTDKDGDGYCAEQDDCDDYNSGSYPGAPEQCDGKDNDCTNGVPSNEVDEDFDGYLVCAGDCNDKDATINPGATEACNGADDNCDGVVPSDESDGDGDGYRTCAGDCDDTDPTSNPSKSEVCDGKDNNCDGSLPADELDGDADGYKACTGDCNDGDAASYPGAAEKCDSVDQNCDGLADATVGTSNAWIRSVCGQVLKGTAGSIDGNGDDQASVIYNPLLGIYQMWFRMQDTATSPIRGRIGYATSSDGATWTKLSNSDGTPKAVLDLGATGAWDAERLGFPSVIIQNGQYYMYYQGQDAANAIKIGLATSTDGVAWTRYAGNPILSGTSGTWDNRTAQAPSVMYNSSKGQWEMYYTGSDGTTLNTGRAVSADGMTWTKDANPVITAGPDAWYNKRAVFARVHVVNGLYHAYFSGDDTSNSFTYEIGYAYSSDGVNFTELPSPVFSMTQNTADWDGFSVYAAETIAVPVGGAYGYSMFYSGSNTVSGPYGVGIARKLSPSASIVAPDDGGIVRKGSPVDFVLEADDIGALDSTVCVFHSDRDGVLGTAGSDLRGRIEFSTTRLSRGDHTITVLTVDAGGLATTSELFLTVE